MTTLAAPPRATYLGPHEMFRLDLACKPLVEAFGTTPVLVGSVLERRDFRDVDVRLILPDEDYERLVSSAEVRTMLCLAFTAYLREATGLPIDFGIQPQSKADLIDGPRNVLGRRKLTNWIGDTPVTAAPGSEDIAARIARTPARAAGDDEGGDGRG